jgi:hypothetical protein
MLQPIREKLSRAQTAFFRAADTIPGEKWDNCPGLDEWSAAELVAHLVVVERGVVTNVDRLTHRKKRFEHVLLAASISGDVKHL